MDQQLAEIGMVGLGTMGRNLLLNIADHNFPGVGYDRDLQKVQMLRAEARERPVRGVESLEELTKALRTPRVVMLLVPAGNPVDEVIRALLPYLQEGDLIIDGGNSFYKDTDLRIKTLADKGIDFMGLGISGGEHGARAGASMMAGGKLKSYERVRPMLEAVAAKANNEPCVAFMGPGSAGHYVKMVHNGIEYGVMELIAESYDLLKRGLGFNDDQLQATFADWNKGELNSYLIEITAQIFQQRTEDGRGRIIDVILDQAAQKGTGRWASQDAMDLGEPVPNIDIAVTMRALSAHKAERQGMAQVYSGAKKKYHGDPNVFVIQLRAALYAAMIITYAQGFELLQTASRVYHYDLELEVIARIWRQGCIIRSALLEWVRMAYLRQPGLVNLLVDPQLSATVMTREAALQAVIYTAADLHLPAPGMMMALSYLDAYHSTWLPANLIQAQRDYFGAHTYERTDAKGVFHTQWEKL
jgi:6-phosphogluconate dehydrogenase